MTGQKLAKPKEFLEKEELPKGDKAEFAGPTGGKYIVVAKLGFAQYELSGLSKPEIPKKEKGKEKEYAKKIEEWKENGVAVAEECKAAIYKVVYKKGKAVYEEVKKPDEYLVAMAGTKIASEAESQREVKFMKGVPKIKETF